MLIFAGSAQYPQNATRPVVTLGNFDGVHLGHRHLLERTMFHAKRCNAPACVFTFEPSPRSLLSPKLKVPRISPWSQKIWMLEKLGIDQLVLERFSHAFAQHPPQWFVREVIQKRLRAQALVVGYDFRFGKSRAGNSEVVREMLPELFIEEVQAQEQGKQIISSSRIRSAVMAGRVEEATTLLGRPHHIHGVVVPGHKRGRTIGFPTANVLPDVDLIPAAGVYAVFIRIDRKQWLSGVGNLGMQPTFPEQRFQIEIHILDFAQDIYGCEVEILFVARLRDEQRFSSVERLITQMHTDIEKTRGILSQTAVDFFL